MPYHFVRLWYNWHVGRCPVWKFLPICSCHANLNAHLFALIFHLWIQSPPHPTSTPRHHPSPLSRFPQHSEFEGHISGFEVPGERLSHSPTGASKRCGVDGWSVRTSNSHDSCHGRLRLSAKICRGRDMAGRGAGIFSLYNRTIAKVNE